MRPNLSTLVLALVLSGSAAAQDQPITSPEDAACRDEARAKLFSTPNPQGLSLFDHGAQLYRACMARSRPAARRARQPSAR